MADQAKAFWIMTDSGGFPPRYGYQCSRCESVSDQAWRECPLCGAVMSEMVIQNIWVDFNDSGMNVVGRQ